MDNNSTSHIGADPVRRMAGGLPIGRDPTSVRRRIEAMEHLLEGLVKIPGLNRTIGLDVMLDLIPIPIGPDLITALMGGWMVWEARNLGMSKGQMARMFANVVIDFLLGIVPVVGAIPDFLFRSNTRNLKIIKRHLDKHYPSTALIDVTAGR
jgi:hypothetical protein